MKHTLICVAVVAAGVACAAREADVERLPIQLETAIHDRFDKIINALNDSPDPPQDNVEARREIKNLKDSVADKSDIVEQLIAYAAVGSDEDQPLKALMILQLLDLPPKIVIPVLAPYLDDDDIKVSSFILDWFRGHDNAGPDETKLKPINFDDYADYVRKLGQAGNVPMAFVEYLFERAPDRAFIVFARAEPKSDLVKAMEAKRKEMEQRRPGIFDKLPPARAGIEDNDLLLAEHMISHAIWLRRHYYHNQYPEALQEAKRHLSQLSERNQWWARLYAAEIMRRHSELEQSDVLEKLSRDENPLVSEAAKGQAARPAPNPGDGRRAETLVAPREVESRAIGQKSVEVTWQASVGATSYAVQRRQPDTETEFTTIAPNVTGTKFIDTDLVKGTLYEYRVIARQEP